MLRLFAIACLAAVALGQGHHGGDFNLQEWITNNMVDDIHGYAVEYDDTHDLVLLVGLINCYLVSAADNRWDAIITHADLASATTEALYHQITANQGVTLISQHTAESKYHSRIEEWQCRDKNIYEVTYVPPTTAP